MERLMADTRIDRARRVASAAASTANDTRNDLLSAVSWLCDVDLEDNDGRDPQEMREALLKRAEDGAKKLLATIAEARALTSLQPVA